MSRRRPTEASWDSDDDLLKDDLPGINAFAKAKHDGSEDELDEDALLGSDNEEIGITDENIELDFETSQNEDLNEDFNEEQAFDDAEVSYDENFDNETYDESGVTYEQETYEDNEDIETSLGVEEALEIGVDEEFEEFGGEEYDISTGEGQSYSQYGGDGVNTTNTEEIEQDVSDTQENDSLIQDDNDISKDVENTQETEEEEESESDSDDEDKSNRGRFKSERSHVVTKSSSVNRTNIPDTLEITEEQQAQIDDFMDNQGRKRRGNRGGRQHGRGGNNQGRGGRYPPPLMGRNPGFNNFRPPQQQHQQHNQFRQQQPYQQHPPYQQQHHHQQQQAPSHYHPSQPNFPTPSTIPGQTYHESYPPSTGQPAHVETPPEDHHLPPDHLIPPDYALSDYGTEDSDPMPPDESSQEKSLTPRKIHLNPHFRPKVPAQPAVGWTEPVPLQLPTPHSQPTPIHPLPLPHPTSRTAGPYTTATPSWTPHTHTSVVPGAYPGGQPAPLVPRLHTPGPTQPYQANFAAGMQPERPADLMSQPMFAPRSQPYQPRPLLGAGGIPPLLGIREHPAPLLNSPSVRPGVNSQYHTPSRPAAPIYHQTPTHMSTVRGQVPFQNQAKNWSGPHHLPAPQSRPADQQSHFPVPLDSSSPRKNFQSVGRGRGHGRGQISNRGQTSAVGRGQSVGISQGQSGQGRGQVIPTSVQSSTPVSTATKRLSMPDDKEPIPEKIPKCEEKTKKEEEPVDEETRILNAKIAEQKKLREKLIRQKEMKRKLAAAQRKKELEERLAAKGLTLADIGADSTGSESDKNTNEQAKQDPKAVESKPVSNPVKSTTQQSFRPPNPMANRPQRPQRPPNVNQNGPRLPSGRGTPNQGIRMSSPQVIHHQGQQLQHRHPRPQQHHPRLQHHPQQQQHRLQHPQHMPRQPDPHHQPRPDQFRMQQPLMQRPFLSPPQQMGANPRNQRMPPFVENPGMRPPGIRGNMTGNSNRQQRPPFNMNSRNPNPQSFGNPVGGPPHPQGAMRQQFRPTGPNQNPGIRPNRHPSMNQRPQGGVPPNNQQSSLVNLAPNQNIRRRLPSANMNARLGNLQQNKRMANPKQLKQVQIGGSGENVRNTNVGQGKKSTPSASNRLVIQGKRTVIASSNKIDQSGAQEDNSKKVICISNLSASTTKAQLANLCKSVGAYENLQMFPTTKKAFVTFQNPEHAVIFSTKFNRYMLDLSHISVTMKS